MAATAETRVPTLPDRLLIDGELTTGEGEPIVVVDADAAIEATEEQARPRQMRRRAHDDRVSDLALEEQRQRSRRVLGGVPSGRLDHEFGGRAAPRVTHLLGLRGPAGRRPAAEDDHIRAARPRERLRLAD